MIAVKRYSNQMDAQLAKQKLKYHGIKSFLLSEGDLYTEHLTMPISMGELSVDLMVVDLDFDEAKKIIEQISSAN